MKRLIVFDLDGTLARSKAPLDAEMAERLGALLAVVRVAIISGGNWPQFQAQVLAQLPRNLRMERLSLLPTCGTKFYRHEGSWKLLYAEDFSEKEKDLITGSIRQAVLSSGFKADQTWGEQIEDRGSQITFSALGQQAPIEAKERWDPDFSRRRKIKALLDALIPECSVRLGGTTSIDVTKPGIDKAYGIRKLRDTLGVAIQDMVYVGDALFPGGNDYPAQEAGVVCIEVRDPEDTKRVIAAIVACLDGAPGPDRPEGQHP
jgi:HAD superfamily hydrolase (TIGR01484 family)